MTKLIAPQQSGHASGKFQNIIYAYNQYGPYSRPFVSPLQPNSTPQLAWRTAYTTLSGNWNGDTGMTQTQRDNWNHFGQINPVRDRFGDQKYLTGRQWFLKLNVWRIYKGLSAQLSPPITTETEYMPFLQLSQNASDDIELTFTPSPVGDEFIYVSRVLNQNLGRNFRPNKTEEAAIIDSSSPVPTIVATAAEIDFEEKRHFFVVRTIDGSGRASPKREMSISATSATQYIIEGQTTNFLDGSNPNTVDTTQTSLSLSNSSEVRAVVLYDLSVIDDPNITIDSAFLQHTFGTRSVSDESFCKRLLVHHNINATTWNEYDISTPWSTPGMENGVDYDSNRMATFTTPPQDIPLQEDITTTVQFWKDNPSEPRSYAVLVNLNGFINWYTSEHPTPDWRPQIIINFSLI